MGEKKWLSGNLNFWREKKNNDVYIQWKKVFFLVSVLKQVSVKSTLRWCNYKRNSLLMIIIINYTENLQHSEPQRHKSYSTSPTWHRQPRWILKVIKVQFGCDRLKVAWQQDKTPAIKTNGLDKEADKHLYSSIIQCSIRNLHKIKYFQNVNARSQYDIVCLFQLVKVT